MEFEKQVEPDQRGKENRHAGQQVQEGRVGFGKLRNHPPMRMHHGHDAHGVHGERQGKGRDDGQLARRAAAPIYPKYA